jgi:hypothetical protein
MLPQAVRTVGVEVDNPVVLVDDLHVMNNDGVGLAGLFIEKYLVGLFADDLEAEIFQQRNPS